MDEVNEWREKYFPLDRLRGYIMNRGLWSEDKEKELIAMNDATIKKAMRR